MRSGLWLLLLPAAGLCDLRADIYSNAALSGLPNRRPVRSLDFQLANFSGASAEVSGRLTIERASSYAFECSFAGGQLVFVWVDDHLVCHTNPPFSNTRSSTDGCPQNPIPYRHGDTPHILLHIYSASMDGSGKVTSGDDARVSVRWVALEAPRAADAKVPFVPVPASALSSSSSALEEVRRTLQRKLASG